jgi:hypothetical protein
MYSILLTLLGLSIFEIVCSIDNAVINAGVLRTMTKKSRSWFLGWGIIFAVVVVRGILPWLIIAAVNPSLGLLGSLKTTFTFNPMAAASFEHAAPVLLAGAGTFLAVLFLHWVYLEEKTASFAHEKFFYRNGAWFWVNFLLLLCAMWIGAALLNNIALAYSATAGGALFGLTYLLKRRGETTEKRLVQKHDASSERSKIIYLELIDGVFSIDAILGALAFTFSVPLILIGNGIGALVMRQLTVKNIHLVKRYKYLKHGAMYALGVLSIVMLLEVVGVHVPQWVSPSIAISFVVIALAKK